MGRGRGGNAGSNRPANSVGNVARSDERVISDAAWKKVVDDVAKGESMDFDSWELLDTDAKDLALMMAGFTGLMGDDRDSGVLYYPTSKDKLVTELAEAMSNDVEGHRIENQSFTIGYADGTRKYVSEMENDFDMTSLTSRQSWKTQQARVKSIIKSKDVAYIIRTDAWEQPRFYVKDAHALSLLKKYGGFEVWRKGRGEKKRDYIQDDWV